MYARKEAVKAKVSMRLQTQKDLTSFLISSTMFFVTATFVWVEVFIDLLKYIEDIAFFDQFCAEVITQCSYHTQNAPVQLWKRYQTNNNYDQGPVPRKTVNFISGLS